MFSAEALGTKDPSSNIVPVILFSVSLIFDLGWTTEPIIIYLQHSTYSLRNYLQTKVNMDSLINKQISKINVIL